MTPLPPEGKITPLRGFVESPDGNELTEYEAGIRYTVDGGTLGLIGLLDEKTRAWVLAQLAENDPEVRGEG